MNILICPVCGGELHIGDGIASCENRHCFDIAKEGYVNLISGTHKSGTLTGDSREMAVSRRRFLDKNWFYPLKKALTEYISNSARDGAALDICCGEGYYSDVLSGGGRSVYAFDLSKEMVRLAAKRNNSRCFVANISSIPVKSGTVSTAIHLFAPFHDREFSRIMSDSGMLLTVVAGKRHLMGMKSVLYDRPYENDEMPPDAPSFNVTDSVHVYDRIRLSSREDISAVLNMTPYGVRSPHDGKERLLQLDSLETEIEFVIYVLKK